VSQTAGKLHRDGLIAVARRSITVLERAKLEVRVCECYDVVKQEYDRPLPPPRGSAHASAIG
jgi:hypothetical protein